MTGKAYALTNNNNNVSQILVSSNLLSAAPSWSVLATSPGIHSFSQGAQPRDTGQLLVQTAANQLWVGGLNGLFLCNPTVNGGGCQVKALSGSSIWSVEANPTGTHLFISVDDSNSNAGLWNYTVSTSSLVQMNNASGEPATPRGLVSLEIGNTVHVYAADGNAGVYDCVQGNNTCTPLGSLPSGSSTPTTLAHWEAIDGTVDANGNPQLTAACDAVVAGQGSNCDSDGANVYRYTAGSGWVPMTVDPHVNSGSGPRWWYDQYTTYSLNGGNHYSASQLLVDPTTPGRAYLAGSGGVWRYNATAAEWNPVPNGLAATTDHGIAAEPRAGSFAYGDAVDADEDWSGIVDTNHFNCCSSEPVATVPQGVGSAALSVVVEPLTSANSDVFVGVGDPPGHTQGTADKDGRVYCQQTNGNDCGGTVVSGWTDLGSPGPNSSGNNAVIGLAAGKAAGDNTITIIAAVDGQGIYYKHGLTDSWHLADNKVVGAQVANEHVDIHFTDGSTNAFILAPGTGRTVDNTTDSAYRSPTIPSGLGNPWTMVWDGSGETANNPGMNYMAAAPGQPTNSHKLYISDKARVFQFLPGQQPNTLDVTGSPSPFTAPPYSPGVVAVGADGNVIVASDISANGAPDLYRGTDQANATVASIGQDGYPEQIVTTSGAAISPDGYIYVSSPSGGVAVRPPG